MNSLEQENAIWHITSHYVSELKAGRQPLLRDYLARYPLYASAIADFVAYYQSVEIPLAADYPGEEESNYLPLSYENRLLMENALRKASLPAQPPPSLFPDVQRSSLLPRLARTLDLSEDLLLLLDQRAFFEASLPNLLIKKLASTLRQSEQAIRLYLTASNPIISPSLETQETHLDPSIQSRYVAEEEYASYALPSSSFSPSQTFLQALMESSVATQDQKEFWSDIVNNESHPATDEEGT